MQPSTPPLYRPSPLRASTSIPLRPNSPPSSSSGPSSLSGRPIQNPYATNGASPIQSEEPDEVKVGEIGGASGSGGVGTRDGDEAIREYEEKRDRQVSRGAFYPFSSHIIHLLTLKAYLPQSQTHQSNRIIACTSRGFKKLQ
jgi:hypothetical protein